jgi:hypothetical protein
MREGKRDHISDQFSRKANAHRQISWSSQLKQSLLMFGEKENETHTFSRLSSSSLRIGSSSDHQNRSLHRIRFFLYIVKRHKTRSSGVYSTIRKIVYFARLKDTTDVLRKKTVSDTHTFAREFSQVSHIPKIEISVDDILLLL